MLASVTECVIRQLVAVIVVRRGRPVYGALPDEVTSFSTRSDAPYKNAAKEYFVHRS